MRCFKLVLPILTSCLFVFSGCSKNTAKETKTDSLKNSYSDMFLIGTALNSFQVSGKDSVVNDIIDNQFNAFTAENAMKWENIHPLPDSFNFEQADKFVEFCESKNGFIVGHVLVWHQQTPQWVFKDTLGNLVSRETLLKTMKEHIYAVVSRYKGRVNGWDVVNEAIADDGSMRNNLWYEIIGEEYVELAFKYTKEADSTSGLYYNDYSLPTPTKRLGVVNLISKLKNKGIKVDGIGMQGHYHLDYPELSDLDSSIVAFSETGVQVMITEMEITVLPNPEDHSGADITVNYTYKDKLNPFPTELPDSMQIKLTARYSDLFKVFIKHRDKISRVTLWGITDDSSWRNHWPIEGRKDYPLLYDRNLQPKPAHKAILDCVNRN